MPSNPKITGTIVKEYLIKYPSVSSHKIAELIIKEVPTLFKDKESARSIIRYYRGAVGAIHRKDLSKDNYLPRINIPEPNNIDYNPYVLNFEKSIFPIMIGSDAHIPYHDQDALEIFIERAIDIKAKTILLDGDWVDFYQLSNWQKDPRNRNVKEELEIFNLIIDMIQKNTNAKIVYKYGNHEERFDNYLMQHAPELFKLESMHLSEQLKLKERNIDIVKDKRIIKLNHLYIIHGHEYKFAISNPVNPARGLFLRAKKNSLCGHFHQTSEHPESTINGDIISCWSIGCLCNLHPEYMPLNKWNHGFAEIYNDEDFFSIRNRKIINYRLV